MSKLIVIPCVTCGTRFMPTSSKNKYCKRSCFKKAHYHKKRKEDLLKKKFPSFVCPSCKKSIDLDFDPLVEHLKWTRFECPFCRTLMISVFDNILGQDLRI